MGRRVIGKQNKGLRLSFLIIFVRLAMLEWFFNKKIKQTKEEREREIKELRERIKRKIEKKILLQQIDYFVLLHTHTKKHVQIYTHILTHTHTYKHVQLNTHILTQKHTHIHQNQKCHKYFTDKKKNFQTMKIFSYTINFDQFLQLRSYDSSLSVRLSFCPMEFLLHS